VADVSVRPAGARDVPEIARIQLDTWRQAYARWLPESVLAGISPDDAERSWREAVTAPPSPRHHVLVARERDVPVGFVAFGPDPETAPDPAAESGPEAGSDPEAGRGPQAASASASDSAPAPRPGDPPGAVGQIAALLVEPRWGRRGHGSRMLAATVDHMRADGLRAAWVWVPEQDTASLAFYTSAGWEPDGYARTLEADGAEVTEVRLHVSLAEGPDE
jgi:ribosomal protein S18 acetylase RimI-like enzyme